MEKYYMTQRPAMPGAMPKDGLDTIEDLDPRDVIPYIGKGAYALLYYTRPLTDKEVSDYELTPYEDVDEILDEAYEGSWYTITGAGGDTQEWKDGYQDLLNKEGIGTITRWERWYGADMNRKYHLTGNNRYKDDLVFMAFPLDGLDITKLAIFKMEMQDRWFDDIVDNNARRERMSE